MQRANDTSPPEPFYPAALYELVHRGTPGDLAFYVEACRGARRVLELGCGYGRVLAALAPTIPDLVGLERNAGLRALAEARVGAGVEIVPGDMTNFALPGEAFDRVLIPHSGLYCLPDDAACEACFRSIGRHLAPDGRLIFDAYAADHFHASEAPADHLDERLDPVVTVTHAGASYDVFERSRWERSAQRLDVTYEYIPRGGGEVLMGTIAHRYLLLEQVEPLLARAGLELLALEGSFEGGAVDPDGDAFVATAAHANAA